MQLVPFIAWRPNETTVMAWLAERREAIAHRAEQGPGVA
jgi:hypothetical protein